MATGEWLIVGVTRVGDEVESWAEKKVGTSIEAFQSQGICTLQTKSPMTLSPGDESHRGTAFPQLNL